MPSTVETHKKNHNETVDTHQSWTSTIVREKIPNMDLCRGRGIVHG